jgi:nucleoside-diphosphate kinase
MKNLYFFILSAIIVIFGLQSQFPIFQDEEIIEEIIVQPLQESKKSTNIETKIDSKKEALPNTIKETIEKDVVQSTLGIIKPDAVEAGFSGKIIELIELNRFEIVHMQKKTLTRKEAEDFYAIHKEKGFFKELITFMTSGPVVVLELKKLNAVRDWRYLMGATNPEKAHLGTLRAMFGMDITHNAVHGSDSVENAEKEIAFFFPQETIKIKETIEPIISIKEAETAIG